MKMSKQSPNFLFAATASSLSQMLSTQMIFFSLQSFLFPLHFLIQRPKGSSPLGLISAPTERDPMSLHFSKIEACIKKNEIKPSAATWVSLESVIRSEVTQTEKGKHCMTPPMRRI